MIYNSFIPFLLFSLWFIHYSTAAPVTIHNVKSDEDKHIQKQGTVKNNHVTIQQCHLHITYNEMHQLLAHSSCALDMLNKSMLSNNRLKLREKRDQTPAITSHVYDLQSTINNHRTIIDDHRKMIHYLMNNTMNITKLNQYYTEQHSKITPHWRSWRDISLLLLIAISVCAFIYLLASRFRPLDALISFLIRRQQTTQQPQRTGSIDGKSIVHHVTRICRYQ